MFDCWVALLLVTPDFSMIVINSDKYLEKIEDPRNLDKYLICKNASIVFIASSKQFDWTRPNKIIIQSLKWEQSLSGMKNNTIIANSIAKYYVHTIRTTNFFFYSGSNTRVKAKRCCSLQRYKFVIYQHWICRTCFFIGT